MLKEFADAIIATKSNFHKFWPKFRFMLPGSIVLFLLGDYLNSKFVGLLSWVGFIFALIGLITSPIALIIESFYYFLIKFVSSLFNKKIQ